MSPDVSCMVGRRNDCCVGLIVFELVVWLGCALICDFEGVPEAVRSFSARSSSTSSLFEETFATGEGLICEMLFRVVVVELAMVKREFLERDVIAIGRSSRIIEPSVSSATLACSSARVCRSPLLARLA